MQSNKMMEYYQRQSQSHTHTTSSLRGSDNGVDVDGDVDNTDNTNRLLGLGGHDRPERRRHLVEQEDEQTQASSTLFHENDEASSSSRQYYQQQLVIPRIIGGTITQPNQYPWLAALYAAPVDDQGELIFSQAAIYLCTGIMIAPSVVLSAAHCAVGDLAVNYIRVGKYDLSNSTTTTSTVTEQGQSFAVQQTIVHPSYNEMSMESYDVALFVLDGAFQVEPSSFSNSNSLFQNKFNLQLNADDAVPSSDTTGTNVNNTSNVNVNVTAVGYGVTDLANAPTTASPVAHEVTIQTMSQQECQARYGQAMIGVSMLCASAPGKDACLGDSGGPLLMQSHDSTDGSLQQILVGVVSWGKYQYGNTPQHNTLHCILVPSRIRT
jgi:secreted trypsin-like serine protease